jgi:D-alanyl-D-alanine carboxypeptidase
MSLGQVSRSHRLAVVGLLAMLTVAGSNWDRADARAPRQHAQKHEAQKHAVHGADYRPPYADIVVDSNSGQVLHQTYPDDPRHPASLTKIMTLYLLFEQLEAGKLKLDTPLDVSAQAASQHPVRLGLKANQTIKVDDAIKALVTRSANDAAVVIAEAIGGSEEEFAKLMTRKAKALGMTGTVYVNASGLPAEEQITTAREQAILGRAIQDRFPDYYRYFSTPSFQYRGAEIRNHNSLLGQVKGVDGIKTGYTDASGYNLVASVHRNDRFLVAVVLGGTSNAARDTRMRQLLEEHIVLASTQRTVEKIVEVAVADDPQESTKDSAKENANDSPTVQPSAPVPVRTIQAAVPIPIPRAAPGAKVAAALASAKTEPAQAPKQIATAKRHLRHARAAAR